MRELLNVPWLKKQPWYKTAATSKSLPHCRQQLEPVQTPSGILPYGEQFVYAVLPVAALVTLPTFYLYSVSGLMGLIFSCVIKKKNNGQAATVKTKDV